MEQANEKQNSNPIADQHSSDPQAATAGAPHATPDAGGQSFDQLMAQSPKLCPFAGWLKCLRKPALSMEYSFQKRHVPDLDNDVQGAHKASGQGNQGATHPNGQNSDTMSISGGFTIRYFDFALGVVGLAIAGCLMKGCGCLKRKMF